VDDPSVDPKAFDWKAHFPGVFERGGFDAVVGNPPYVRHHHVIPIKPYLERRYASYHGLGDLYIYFFESALDLLRQGGRMAFVVTNKWMRANYGESIRRIFSERAWVDQIIDFGHAKQFFCDAEVFPCFIVVRRPPEAGQHGMTRVCVIPRETVDVVAIDKQIRGAFSLVSPSRLTQDPWSLESPAVETLLSKIRGAGRDLATYTGTRPLIGIVPGLSQAFLIDSQTRDRLIQQDSKCSHVIRPYLRGQDLRRWHAQWAGLWMIKMASSSGVDWPWSSVPDELQAERIFQAIYPSLYSHFKGFEAPLRARFPQNIGRYWWEVRTCQYWSDFDQPKVVYQDITWLPKFCRDDRSMMVNSTVYFVTQVDPWLLAVLNSPAGWWYAFRTAQHGKDEALRYFTTFVESFPVPEPRGSEADHCGSHVDRLVQLTAQQQAASAMILDWLAVQHGITDPNTRLQESIRLEPDGFVIEVQRAHGRRNPLTAAALRSLRDEYARTIEPARALAAEAMQLEYRLHDIVNGAYGLSLDDVRLMWDTAPPRMPIPRPASV
jgi:hypothetical protein